MCLTTHSDAPFPPFYPSCSSNISLPFHSCVYSLLPFQFCLFVALFSPKPLHTMLILPLSSQCSLPPLPNHYLQIRAASSPTCHLKERVEICQRVKETRYPNPKRVDGCLAGQQGQYLDKMPIPLPHRCWEEGGYLDSYLGVVPGPISRHQLISLKLVGHLINLKLPPHTLWQLAGRSIFCLTCQITYRKRLDFVANDASYPGKFLLAVGISVLQTTIKKSLLMENAAPGSKQKTLNTHIETLKEIRFSPPTVSKKLVLKKKNPKAEVSFFFFFPGRTELRGRKMMCYAPFL